VAYNKTMNNNLTLAEKDKLKKSISLITVLIAGADGNIEKEELTWAKKIAGVREYGPPTKLHSFYQDVGVDYEENVNALIDTLPADVAERTKVISDRLAELNPILAKLDNDIASAYYKSFITFAEHVAKATGGILGFFSVSSEEKSLITLPMIDVIEYDETAEED